MAPARVISGTATKIARTVHGIAYDPVRDEIYVTNALADAVLVFRGGANGAEPPVRIIEGPCTGLVNPHAVSLDLEHREILVSSLSARAIAIFPMDANGNATPIRYIKGPKTKLGHTVGMGVDPRNERAGRGERGRLLVFRSHWRRATSRRSARSKASTPGFATNLGACKLRNGKIFVAASNHLHINLYQGVALKPEYNDGDAKVPEDPWLNPELGFIGVWNVTGSWRCAASREDRRSIQPTGASHRSCAQSADGEIYVTDSIRNGFFSFLVPDLLK